MYWLWWQFWWSIQEKFCRQAGTWRMNGSLSCKMLRSVFRMVQGHVQMHRDLKVLNVQVRWEFQACCSVSCWEALEVQCNQLRRGQLQIGKYLSSFRTISAQNFLLSPLLNVSTFPLWNVLLFIIKCPSLSLVISCLKDCFAWYSCSHCSTIMATVLFCLQPVCIFESRVHLL